MLKGILFVILGSVFFLAVGCYLWGNRIHKTSLRRTRLRGIAHLRRGMHRHGIRALVAGVDWNRGCFCLSPDIEEASGQMGQESK
jgi:hypothetical protein